MFRSIQTVGQTERYMRVFRKKKTWHTMGRQILQCRVLYVNNWKKRRKKLKSRVKWRDWWRSKSEKAVDGGNSLAFCTLLYMRTGLGCCPSRSYPGLERGTSLRKKSTGLVFSSTWSINFQYGLWRHPWCGCYNVSSYIFPYIQHLFFFNVYNSHSLGKKEIIF